MCNYYTLRQDGSNAYMRSWALQVNGPTFTSDFWKIHDCLVVTNKFLESFQGSMDAENWVDLRVHDNDQMICKPAQFASWPVHGSTTLLPFRFFRVILTGPTTSDSTPWNLCICFLELYGYLH